MTFERNQIVTFCSKQCFKLIEILEYNLTSFLTLTPLPITLFFEDIQRDLILASEDFYQILTRNNFSLWFMKINSRKIIKKFMNLEYWSFCLIQGLLKSLLLKTIHRLFLYLKGWNFRGN